MANVAKVMNATIVTGEYQNNQGEAKKSYMTIGTLFIYDDGGMSLKLDAVPLGNGNISFYDKKPKEDNNQNGGQGQQQSHNQGRQDGGQQQEQYKHTDYQPRQYAQQNEKYRR